VFPPVVSTVELLEAPPDPTLVTGPGLPKHPGSIGSAPLEQPPVEFPVLGLPVLELPVLALPVLAFPVLAFPVLEVLLVGPLLLSSEPELSSLVDDSPPQAPKASPRSRAKPKLATRLSRILVPGVPALPDTQWFSDGFIIPILPSNIRARGLAPRFVVGVGDAASLGVALLPVWVRSNGAACNPRGR
jgi:hypothetical protein